MPKLTLHVNPPGSMGSNPPRSGPTNFTMINPPATAPTAPRSGPTSFTMANAPTTAPTAPRSGPTSFTMVKPPATAPTPPTAPSTHSVGAGSSTAPTSGAFPTLGNHAVSAPPSGPNPFKKAFESASSLLPVPSNTSNPSTSPTNKPPPMLGDHTVSAALPVPNQLNAAQIPTPVRSGHVDLNARNPFQSAVTAPSLPFPTVVPWAPVPAITPSGLPTVPTAVQSNNHFTQAPITVGFGRYNDQFKSDFLQLARISPGDWEAIVGLYLQDSGRTPYDIGCSAGQNDWARCKRRLDRLEKNDVKDIDRWLQPPGDTLLMHYCVQVLRARMEFEHAVREWANNANPMWVTWILKKAGWQNYEVLKETHDWQVMDGILKMPDAEERCQLMAQAKEESPRFFEECERNIFCGMRRYMKRRTATEENDHDFEYDEEYQVLAVRVLGSDVREEYPKSPPKKPRVKYQHNMATGQPTQFHAVPLEERAIDSKGNRLPWSLEYHEDHPNARGQKRHPEERGPFGKSTRRKGSSRTRTATPAKKENPTLDGFEKALQHDAQLAAEEQEAHASSRAHNGASIALRTTPSHTKEPTQIMIYGYTPSRCYAAIDRYEKVSGGVICEDYPREPPSELQKYQTPFSASRSVHSRPRTKQEIALANKYAGGNCWIKLTCDSAEAAARAVELSPTQVYGHWVYAELYNGKGPEIDQPIPITEDDRREGPFNSPRPPRKPSQTLSAAFSQHATTQKRATSTLPRNFASQADGHPTFDADLPSPSTASSATATGPEYPSIRNRHQSQAEQSTADSTSHEIAPGIPRYTLRPASEAFLPQPSWWERQVQWLSAQGLIPTDFIGDGLPILENGDFDWDRASWYWRICYWLDSHIGTDICGLKED